MRYVPGWMLRLAVLWPVQRRVGDAQEQAHEGDAFVWAHGQVADFVAAHKDVSQRCRSGGAVVP